jgi:hypothetical protein
MTVKTLALSLICILLSANVCSAARCAQEIESEIVREGGEPAVAVVRQRDLCGEPRETRASIGGLGCRVVQLLGGTL